jgi:V/A-type H+-transporting ATPase subunit A
MEQVGEIYKVSGPVVVAENVKAKMYDLVKVGKQELMGEVIEISGNQITIQVYESTSGLKPGDPVKTTNMPLSVELGPGLLSQIFDGVQRPLNELMRESGEFIGRGITVPALNRTKTWEFTPSVKKGDRVKAGHVIGHVKEAETIEHRIVVPPNVEGTVEKIEGGNFKVTETVAELSNGIKLKLMHNWPIRRARPYAKKLMPDIPLITGQRIFDTLFPLAKGGTAAIPGPFGSGKTVMQQSLAKWSDADVIVYIGCGERGNEMTEVLTEFPELEDPRTGRPLMERTILIANTSNMPVAAREASIYTGITLAEYYRDQGYDVALMADSTSRWAEAMREISSRLEEMPGEEGYPAYLASRIASFYERAGRVKTLAGTEGSVTVIGAVSPPGGDFSEPVTQNTLKVTKVFWALDSKLAQRRHFPAINWLTSYSLYAKQLNEWFRENVDAEWPEVRAWAMAILQKEAELQEIVQLVGADALPEKERLVLETARIIREGFLQQNAFHEVDAYCPPTKQIVLLESIKHFYDEATQALTEGATVEAIMELESVNRLIKACLLPEEECKKEVDKIKDKLVKELKKLMG